MTDAFELEIVRPLESEKIPIQWISCDGANGSFLIGPDHLPLISLLKDGGVVTYEELSKEPVTISVFGGIVVVNNNKVLLLLDY